MSALHEILAPLMLDVGERESVDDQVGIVTRKWMENNVLTYASVSLAAPVFDLTNPGAVQFIRSNLSMQLLTMGLDDLDFSHVLGNNRELTRAISRWLWLMINDAGDPLFSGVRYRSRFNPESLCLALYQDRFTVNGEIDTESITSTTPGLAEAASTLRLSIS